MEVQLEVKDFEALRPLIREAVLEAIAEYAPSQPAPLDERIAFTEKEAAKLIGVGIHVLREQRRLGNIAHFANGPGRRIMYSPKHILDFLNGSGDDTVKKEAAKNGKDATKTS